MYTHLIDESEIARIAKAKTGVKLTDAKIAALQPKDKKYFVWHDSGLRGVGRVGVGVSKNGLKELYYRAILQGKTTLVRLGYFPEMSLQQAFDKALDLKSLSQRPQGGVKFSTLSDLFDDYIGYNESIGKRSMKTTRSRLNQVLESKYIIPTLAANQVTTDMIIRCLAEFIERGAVAGSNKVRSNLHAAFNFGLHYDNDPANINKEKRYGLKFNPVTLIPKQRGAEKALDRFLSWEELRDFIASISADIEQCPMKPNYARLALLCIMTGGQRPYEIVTVKNKNIDLVAKLLTITPDISKTENFHVVPLSDAAVNLIKKQQELSPKSLFLFPAPTKEGHMLTCEFAKQLRKYCLRTGFEPFTPRDLRRTFKTLAGALGIDIELRDILQNHKRQGTSAKHYDRYQYLKEKREIIELWNKTLEAL